MFGGKEAASQNDAKREQLRRMSLLPGAPFQSSFCSVQRAQEAARVEDRMRWEDQIGRRVRLVESKTPASSSGRWLLKTCLRGVGRKRQYRESSAARASSDATRPGSAKRMRGRGRDRFEIDGAITSVAPVERYSRPHRGQDRGQLMPRNVPQPLDGVVDEHAGLVRKAAARAARDL
jgi:hypothetical protein